MVERQTVAVPRLIELDALRGFALGGILLVNITVMSDPGGFADGPALNLLEAVFHNKFYVLFSFLFGYSLTIQFRSADRDGASARARTVRRCLALMAIGFLHSVFLFTGDVLFGYGAVGLVLLSLSGLRPRTALRAAGAIFAVCVTAMTILSLFAPAVGAKPDGAEHDRLLGMMRAGWGTAAHWRWDEFTGNLPIYLLFGLLNVLPLFLVGFAAGKSRLLENPDRYLPLLPRIQLIGFAVGAPISILAAVTHWPVLAGPTMIADPLLSAAYAATLLRIMHTRPQVAAIFAPAGKIAATTYISQSMITAVIFTGYGFSQAGRLSDWTVIAIALTIYVTQLAAARLWVAHHRYGPLEYILRAATYGPTRLRRPTAVES